VSRCIRDTTLGYNPVENGSKNRCKPLDLNILGP
jgi:hypothetical protein